MERFAALWGGLVLVALSSGAQPLLAPAVPTIGVEHSTASAQSAPKQQAPLPTQKPAAGTRPAPALATATDPVCGMDVLPATKHHHTYKGKTYGFCSASCQRLFVAKPQQYVP